MNLKLKAVFLLLTFLFIQIYAQNLSPIGNWKTIDDVTGREKSIVKIWEENSKLYGKIIKLFRLPDEDPDPICDECKGKNKDKQVLGMTIMWNLSQKKDQWKGGKILDPENGKIYGCKIRVIENGEKLEVRGFLGISLLGRNQIWEKVE
ncbi:MAG: DUF2147 domain-containing protein [Armatimonadetes bacterium]|nr:DUF2147 domain-containing protein [Armatimonadota bacterium]